MLNFQLTQLFLRSLHKFYLPLPKLTATQLAVISERMVQLGYKVQTGQRLRASREGEVIWVEPGGLCHSNSDLVDSVSPIIPSLLSSAKERVSRKRFTELYYNAHRARGFLRVRFNPRMESLSIWRELRREDEAGFTPDEVIVLRAILGNAAEDVRAVTDKPIEGAQTLQIGRRVYYLGPVSAKELANDLRTLGHRGTRNAYLPQSCVLEMRGSSLPSQRELSALSEELGEWCYFTPVGYET